MRSRLSELARELDSAGQYLAAAPLQPVSSARSVRVRQGQRLVADGPFAETREQLGGDFLVDSKDVDEAVDVAARIPMATRGTVEVRPVATAAPVNRVWSETGCVVLANVPEQVEILKAAKADRRDGTVTR